MNTPLFPNNTPSLPQKSKIGQANVEYAEASSILTKGKGFLDGYDYSLNPYSGCSFGCNYCYAAFFALSSEKRSNWGNWIKVKENALALLKKKRKRPLIDKTIYISSVTDPYQPIEKNLELTCSILQELLDYHQPKVVIQTRSPLITRDIDLLQRFKAIQVNMTVTTDSEDVRKAFEPYCPSNKVRLEAIKTINDANILSCITMTPLLPVADVHQFSKMLLDTGIKKFIIQPFHADKGKFVAGTREEALKVIKRFQWNNQKYEDAVKVFKTYIPEIGEGKSGFAP